MAKITKAKALTNFYSAEFGSVSVGDELTIGNQSTMDDLKQAGYVEEIGSMEEGSVSATQMEDMAAQAASMPNANAMKTEFASESQMDAQAMNNAAAAQQPQANAQSQANAQDVEFAQEQDMTQAKKSARASKQANKVDDNA